jgi:hypothetical protein
VNKRLVDQTSDLEGNSMTLAPLRAALAITLFAWLAGCATNQVRGGFVDARTTLRDQQAPGPVLVVFLDQVTLAPSGLSALRVNAPAPMAGFDELTAAYRRVASLMASETPNERLLVHLQSERPKPVAPAPRYLVFAFPRSVSRSPSNWFAVTEISIRNSATDAQVWKGEVTVSSDSRNPKIVAQSFVQTLRTVGLLSPGP